MIGLGCRFELEISGGKFKQSKLIKSSLENMGKKFVQDILLNDRKLINNKFLVICETFSDLKLLDNMYDTITDQYTFENASIHPLGNTLTAYGCKNILNISYLLE